MKTAIILPLFLLVMMLSSSFAFKSLDVPKEALKKVCTKENISKIWRFIMDAKDVYEMGKRIYDIAKPSKTKTEDSVRAAFFKVWSADGKRKSVTVSDRRSLVEQGCAKLELGENENVKIYLQDGTEIDDDESFRMLPGETVIYLLRDFDKRPWLSDACPVDGCS